jgi:hypothetical protein
LSQDSGADKDKTKAALKRMSGSGQGEQPDSVNSRNQKREEEKNSQKNG